MKGQIRFLQKEAGPVPDDINSNLPFEPQGTSAYIMETIPETDRFLFYSEWVKLLKQFPIYAVVEWAYWAEEMSQDFEEHDISYVVLGARKKFIRINVRTPEQFDVVYEWLENLGSMNFLTLWSNQEEFVHIEEREVRNLFGFKKKIDNLVVDLPNNGAVFWLGHDGDMLVTFSNDELFSSLESIQEMIPTGAKVELFSH